MPNNKQIQTEAIDIINTIFTKILNNLQEQLVLNQPGLYKQQFFNLKRYREALIDEVNAGRYEHPLRAAVALEKLHSSTSDAEFTDNLSKFKRASQDSGLYPTTKKIGAILGFVLLETVSIALSRIISPWLLIPLSAAQFFYIVGAIPEVLNPYQDVYDAKEKSKEVYNCYYMFRKPPAAPAAPPPYNSHALPFTKCFKKEVN